MRLALVPKTTAFYDLFAKAGENLLETARLVERRFAEFPEHTVRQTEVKALETRGDDLTRETLELLNTQYITPFDREDIYDLAKVIDDVVDYMEEASDLLGLYKVETRLDAALEQCNVLVQIAELKTATRGERARVETLVAIEFAVSWNPFVKSKKRAVTITAASVRFIQPFRRS